MRHGLTLTSLMVAVALSGVLAVAGTRLVVNQMNAMRVMELKDKGDSIFEFYSNLLHDDKVWWCSLYDYESAITPATAKTAHTPNKAMRDCVLGLVANCDSGNTMQLIGPDCQIQFSAQGTRNFIAGDYRPGTIFIPASGKELKDSVMIAASGGWWKVEVKWEDKGNRAVDLILTQKLTEERWESAATGKRYLPKLQNREMRIRRSTNYVPSNSDTTKAVTKIALHTASRLVSHHNDPLVDTTTTTAGLGNCHERDPKGQVVMSVGSTNACSGNRVAVTPTSCASRYSVIAQIGTGADVTAANNVKCALDGDGKLVQYAICGGTLQRDMCSVAGKTFYSPAPSEYYSSYRGEYGYSNYYYDYTQQRWQVEWIPSPRPWIAQTGLARITNWGGLECVGLPSWPAPTQGPAGRKGFHGSGPEGPRGPAYYQTCQ